MAMLCSFRHNKVLIISPLRLLIMGMLILHSLSGIAQKATPKIETIDFSYSNDKLIVSFEIANYKSGDFFQAELFVMDENNRLIKAKSYVVNDGAIQISGGKHLITWNIRNDGYVLNQKIKAGVAIKQVPHISLSKHLIKSSLAPGWGSYRLDNFKHHYLYSVSGYGLIAGAIVCNRMADANYNDYKKSMEITESDRLFQNAKTLNNLSYFMAGGAVAIRAFEYYKLLSRYNKVKNNITPQTTGYYYQKSEQQFQAVSASKHVDNRNAYDLAMESGQKHESNDNDYAARTAYESALAHKPGDVAADVKLKAVNARIAQKETTENKYNELLAKADKAFQNKEYNEAKSLYHQALLVIPGRPHPQKQLDAITRLEKAEAEQQKYDALIADAEIAMTQEKFEDAIGYYNQAARIKPNEQKPKSGKAQAEKSIAQNTFNSHIDYGNKALATKDYELAATYFRKAQNVLPDNPLAQRKLDEVNQIIVDIAEAENTRKYKEAITEADKAFGNKMYSKALLHYEAAAELKPSESYPKNKITQINGILAAQKGPKLTLPDLFKKCSPAVFLLFTEDDEGSSQGSGFFITSGGIAITNYHVYNGINNALIHANDKNHYKIDKVLAKDEDMDYIIFQVKNPKNIKFPFVEIAPVMPEIGEDVFAIGNPRGFEQTLSNGIVSGYRDKSSYIQTTTPITHGSSGGPLFNMDGKVIGITTLGTSDGSLFFAVNIKKLRLWRFF